MYIDLHPWLKKVIALLLSIVMLSTNFLSSFEHFSFGVKQVFAVE